ncbi:hypothetical protein [Neptunomonas japonica]|uniref:hypothetical protein n=1 Tax=Neptunomonas japonica TaxID=417574 RepID=UPI00191606E8|nr:hypothetical protein [Neptunomonas japonica]
MAKLTVQVSVETVFQKALTRVVEAIEKEHGIKISNVNFSWNDFTDTSMISHVSKSNVSECEITSSLSIK